ncbi:MAG: radical SAM protein [archaeon]
MKYWKFRDYEGYISVEFTDSCNLKCIMCEAGTDSYRQKRRHGYMDVRLFRKICDDIKYSAFKARTLVPFWLGEPLSHPKFSEMVEYLTKDSVAEGWNKGFESFEIHTNGTLLSPEISDRLLSLNVNRRILRIVLSLDAIHESTYGRIRKGGDLRKTMENIKYFIGKRKGLGISYPLIVLQFIVMKENASEADEFIDYWKSCLAENEVEVVSDEKDYSGQRDSILIRRLDTSFGHQQAATELHRAVVSRLSLGSPGTRKPDADALYVNPIHFLRSKKDTEVIEINPYLWVGGRWDKDGPYVWAGDEKYRDGLCSVIGVDCGSLTYKFDSETITPSRILVYTKIASHSKAEEMIDDNASEVTLVINGIEIETKLVYFYPNRDTRITKWMVENEETVRNIALKKSDNTLKLEIKDTARCKNGLMVYYRTLTDEYSYQEMPIIVALEK